MFFLLIIVLLSFPPPLYKRTEQNKTNQNHPKQTKTETKNKGGGVKIMVWASLCVKNEKLYIHF